MCGLLESISFIMELLYITVSLYITKMTNKLSMHAECSV